MSTFFPDDDEPERYSAQDPRAEHHRRSRWLPRLLAVVSLVVVTILVAATVYVGSIDRSTTQNIRRQSDLLPDQPTAPDESPRPKKSKTKAINYLVMGSDSRNATDAGQGRSDVLMLLHLAGDRRSAYLVSFPRDMYVTIPGRGKNKINAAFAFGGPRLTVRTVERLTDTRIDHVAVVDFDGFISVTEELGGVTVNNKYYSKSEGYEFPVGAITIEGEEALAYVRERKQLPGGDLDRSERQRAVVKAVVAKGLSGDTIASPIKFNRFVSTVARNITVDDQLTNSELRKTALSLRLTGSDITSLQAPISGFGTTADGQSIDIVDEQQMEELAQALQTDQMDSYVAKYPS